MDNNKRVEEFIETIYPEGAELAKQFFHEDVVWKDAIKGINKLQAERDNLKEQVYCLEADKQHLLDNCEELEQNLKVACSERDRYREAINQFVIADTGLREDYRDYCDDNGEAPDWVFEHEEFFHKLWDKAIARLHEIVGEEALKEAEDE